MNKERLGMLRKVDIHEFWEGAHAEFISWLSEEENAALLGETIGVTLELVGREGGGPARADLVCKDAASDRWVLIDVQFDRTGHERLGRILSGAAGLDAASVVWIAQQFTEEHRATLDWLNEITDSRFRFYGVEIELWQIEQSPVAPRFSLVAKPNDWTRGLSATTAQLVSASPPSARRLFQLEYWMVFRELLLRAARVVRPTNAYPRSWMSFAIGRSNFRLLATLSVARRSVGVAVVMDGPDARAHFHLLQAQRGAIERELEARLDWREQRDAKESMIVLERETDPSDRSRWEEQHRWLLDGLERFHAVLSPRIKDLDADEYLGEEATDG